MEDWNAGLFVTISLETMAEGYLIGIQNKGVLSLSEFLKNPGGIRMRSNLWRTNYVWPLHAPAPVFARLKLGCRCKPVKTGMTGYSVNIMK